MQRTDLFEAGSYFMNLKFQVTQAKLGFCADRQPPSSRALTNPTPPRIAHGTPREGGNPPHADGYAHNHAYAKSYAETHHDFLLPECAPVLLVSRSARRHACNNPSSPAIIRPITNSLTKEWVNSFPDINEMKLRMTHPSVWLNRLKCSLRPPQ